MVPLLSDLLDTHGVPDPELVSPDGAAHEPFLLDRPGNDGIQLDLFLSYGSNPPLYPAWQEYFRRHQPPVLTAWGKNAQLFPAASAVYLLLKEHCSITSRHSPACFSQTMTHRWSSVKE